MAAIPLQSAGYRLGTLLLLQQGQGGPCWDLELFVSAYDFSRLMPAVTAGDVLGHLQLLNQLLEAFLLSPDLSLSFVPL